MSRPDWISLSRYSGTGPGTVIVQADPNQTPLQRDGYITIRTSSGESKDVDLFQNGQENIRCTATGYFENNTDWDYTRNVTLFASNRPAGSGDYGDLQCSFTISAHTTDMLSLTSEGMSEVPTPYNLKSVTLHFGVFNETPQHISGQCFVTVNNVSVFDFIWNGMIDARGDFYYNFGDSPVSLSPGDILGFDFYYVTLNAG